MGGFSSGGKHSASGIIADSATLVGTGVDVQAVFEELDNAIVAAEGALTTHAALDLSSVVHGFKGLNKFLVNGATEVIAVNEIQTLTLTGGVDTNTFKLTFNAHESTGTVTCPAGGYADITAAQIKACLITISDWVTVGTADIAVVKTLNDYAITFTGSLAATDIGAITLTSATGAAAGSVAETLKGVTATVYTITGLAVGDLLLPVTQYATKAAIATQTLRPTTDFTIGAGTLTVAANPVNNVNNELLVEWVDLT